MATATSRGRKLSKPRQSLAILEASALVSAVVLLAWLALWFIHQRAQGLRVEAHHLGHEDLAAAEAPFPAADVRTLLDSADEGHQAASAADGLLDAARAACSRPGGPVLLYVSAPTLDAGPEPELGSTTLRAFLEEIVKAAKCDVVLALDLAQVDSDRDLGVYANAPYRGLVDVVESIEPGEHAVYVLTSAAPGQKSWGSEALGRSAFAHFLREGLAGEARGWDATEILGRVTVEGLHRYVHQHVSRWARDHRRAVQTPLIARIGEARRPIALAFVPRPAAPEKVEEPAPPPRPPAEAPKEAAKGEPAAKPEPPPVEPRVALLNDLLEEWKRHDALLDRSPPPYRSQPAGFRSYQASLVRAERRLRAAWSDPASIEVVREDVRTASRGREEVESALKEAEERARSFPFRPAGGDEEGRRAVTDALLFLTDTAPADRALYAPPPPAEAPKADAGAKPDAGPKPPSPARPDPPRALADAVPHGFPERYLELQLPAWSLRFARDFEVPDHFRDERRSAILHRLVEVRARAEEALAADRRGLDWIRPAIAKGDDERRRLQDRVFAPDQATDEAGKELLESIPILGRSHYEPASRAIQAYKEGRATWERVAAELPDLAEWAVRARARRPEDRSLEDSPLPADVSQALDDAEALAQALDRPIPTGGDFAQAVQGRLEVLSEASRKARTSLAALEKGLHDSARSEGRDWTAIDAALGTPWLPAESRRSLLQALVRRAERVRVEPERSTIDADEVRPADPGFWSVAGGLAALDERLREIAGGASPADAGAALVTQAWEAAKGAPGSPDSVDAAVPAFWKYAEHAARLRERARVDRSRRLGGEPKKPEDLHASLQADDRAIRLMGRGELRSDARAADGLVDAWDRLARLRTLVFHAERLQQDFVASAPSAVQEAVALARGLGVQEPRDPFVGGGSLALRTDPAAGSPLKIGDDGLAELRLGVAPPDEGREGRVPAGRAFVGLASPPEGLRVQDARRTPAASPPGALREVGPGADSSLGDLVVRQVDPAINADTYELRAMAFYRGRVDQRAAVPLTVVPRAYAELVKLQISHDLDELRSRFGDKTAALIEDQFKFHPGEGAMHRGKSASYRLNFTNVTFRDLTLFYRRTLADPGGAEPEIPVDEEEKSLVLPAGKTLSLPGVVTSAQAAIDKPRDLRVAWRLLEKKEPMKPLSVRFRQVDVERYMEFRPSIGVAEHDGVPQECFVVQFVRKSNDPVREPILGREISGMINGIKTSFAPSQLIMPGKSFTMTQPRTPPGAIKFTWSAEIENDRLQPREFNGP
ncbi:hypothetical protein [Paludisphaera soli]|uniref:hypothetical protein n=1 Tax=Paludisphaera soli TaxID=2712865 RepID=UPI0013ED46F9|nr:hypothetical protein [Paludisphaera soli]